MPNARIEKLEETAAHLARIVDDLNAVVTSQADEIDILNRRVRLLMERLAEAEYDSQGSIPLADQKPPHW